MKKLSAILLAAALALPSTSFAATDGILTTTSEGTVNVKMAVDVGNDFNTQVTGLQDVDFGSFPEQSTSRSISHTISNICIYSDSQSSFFDLEIDSKNGPRGVGYMHGGNGQPPGVSYEYTWVFTDKSGNTATGATKSNLQASGVKNCANETKASLTLTLKSGQNLYETGDFDDVLTLTINPS